MVLSASAISKSFGGKSILNNVSFVLNQGEHVGCVGANGVGKSTLLRIIVGELEPDSGSIALAKGVEVGYLAQTLAALGSKTIDELLAESRGNLRALQAQIRLLEQVMAAQSGESLKVTLAEYGELAERFERRGGYDLDYQIEFVLASLRLEHLPREREVATLSGGEKARVALAALLIGAPDLLLLDEPTNHLDVAALEWLEGYLQGYRGAVFAVSHDRHFLNRTVTAILDIEEHSREMKQYVGNYDSYLEAKAKARVRWEEEYERQQEEISDLRRAIKTKARNVAANRPARDGDKMAYDFKAGRIDVAISRNVRAAEEKLRRIEEEPIPKPPVPLRISAEFDAQALGGGTPLWATGLEKSFGPRKVLDGVTLSLGLQSRVVLMGPNGAGKSTLLRILAGMEEADAGQVRVSPAVRLGYREQEPDVLKPQQTVFDAYSEGQIGYREALKAALLDTGLFVYEELAQQVGSLSIGQRRKLQLARLIAQRANLLLLDEPTNHIAFDVLEQFEAALVAFPGPIIAVSHDRWFNQRFAQEVWHLKDGALTHQHDPSVMEG